MRPKPAGGCPTWRARWTPDHGRRRCPCTRRSASTGRACAVRAPMTLPACASPYSHRRGFLRSRCAGVMVGRCGRSGKGFKEQPSTYRISAAPTGRGRCRRCRNLISKGETRFEVCVFVRPGRYTLLLRCTKQTCIDRPLAAAILDVYKCAARVPVDAVLEGGAEAHRVVHAITSASLEVYRVKKRTS